MTVDDERWTEARCTAMDAVDPLRSSAARFLIPDGLVYLDGNSLGPPLRTSARRLAEFADAEWGRNLVGGWERDGWIDAGARIGARIAPLVGADPDEVIVCDSTTINLVKLVSAACAARPGRRVIVAADDDFPTDVFVVDDVAGRLGADVVRLDPAAMVVEALTGAAVVVLSHVHFRTGRIHDMAAISAAAHAAGALVLWDLSHSVGAMPVDLRGCDVDLAVGCTYKYLNGGPGAPAFAYVARRLQDDLVSPIAGWLGHASPFAFTGGFVPAPGVGRLVTGTPSIAAHVALDHALDAWDGVDIAQVRRKSAELGALFLATVEEQLPRVFTLRSPRDPSERGGHVSLGHPEGYRIVRALVDRGVVGDFRAPDVLRFGFAGLYLSFTAVRDAALRLVDVMRTGDWRDPRFAVRGIVT